MIATSRWITSVAFAASLALCAGAASAQNAPADAGAEGDGSVEATVRTENGRRVYVASTTIEVRGEIQRPYAFSVSGRSSLGYTYFEQSISFVREILDALRRSPF